MGLNRRRKKKSAVLRPLPLVAVCVSCPDGGLTMSFRVVCFIFLCHRNTTWIAILEKLVNQPKLRVNYKSDKLGFKDKPRRFKRMG